MITTTKFKDRRTGEIVESFNIFDVDYMQKLCQCGADVGLDDVECLKCEKLRSDTGSW